MTRMTTQQESERARVEDALFGLGAMRLDLRLARLRVGQARQRFPATEWLLAPVSAYLESWEARLEAAIEALGASWQAGNRLEWRRDGHRNSQKEDQGLYPPG